MHVGREAESKCPEMRLQIEGRRGRRDMEAVRDNWQIEAHVRGRSRGLQGVNRGGVEGRDRIRRQKRAGVLTVRRHRGSGRGLLGALVLAAPAAHGDVPERAAARPVPLARLAEVPWLRQAVVVVVAELGVGGVAARASQGRLRMILR
ncbi:hypothetical protein C4D60_Mb09t10600 [Musa balbisiana]|uniref:Uncharacterized protein n=1 Tax=Musa balbisiana TaxID=52838 RepID=A0A4S8IFI9_MUSBA|nr:hypothetical protein C4D60_Mb09t10600 [Musa balbisiana]